MKKVWMICLTMILALCLGISAFAATGGFVSSPSGNQAPELVKGENEDEECEAELIITAYGGRDELSEEARQKIEAAYSMIIGTTDLSTLNGSLKKIAKNAGVETKDLFVSDLFDISATECNGHVDHGHFDITLKSETLKNFVCLLHYYNGEWRVVENAKITNNGEHLEFDEDEFSPFAIVVAPDAENVEQPQNNNLGWIIGSAVVGVVVVAGLVAVLVFLLRIKKKKV